MTKQAKHLSRQSEQKYSVSLSLITNYTALIHKKNRVDEKFPPTLLINLATFHKLADAFNTHFERFALEFNRFTNKLI